MCSTWNGQKRIDSLKYFRSFLKVQLLSNNKRKLNRMVNSIPFNYVVGQNEPQKTQKERRTNNDLLNVLMAVQPMLSCRPNHSVVVLCWMAVVLPPLLSPSLHT